MMFGIGDVHGHSAELAALHAVIRGEIDRHSDRSHSVIHLGDYIDRGPDSRGVLDILCSGIGRPVEQVFLLGNHEQFLLEMLIEDPSPDPRLVQAWFDNGGLETVVSLGLGLGTAIAPPTSATGIDNLRRRIALALGERRIEFLRRLQPIHKSGEFVFVHAGIDPSMPLEHQDLGDLLMIRKPFLGAGAGWEQPFCVVHGHTIEMPNLQPHRIGVDTGCFVNGLLCAVQLAGRRARFLAVTAEHDFPWDAVLEASRSPIVWSPPQQVWAGDAVLPAIIDSGFDSQQILAEPAGPASRIVAG